MNITGIIVGLATFLIIGLFHPIVIKAEYYLGVRCWWMFLIAGIVFCVLSFYFLFSFIYYRAHLSSLLFFFLMLP